MHQDKTLWWANLSKAKRSKEKPKKLVLGDDAIESCETDWFEFEVPAGELTKQLYEISKSSGICCGIIGSWGSGKSSFMKLMVEYVRKKYSRKACIAWFTAWDPGGIEDLGDAMLYRLFSCIAAEHSDLSGAFKELQQALGIRKSIRERARQALGVVSKAGVVVPDVGRVADVASGLLQEFDAPRGVHQSFDKLVEWLDKKDMTVFLFVDDIDRTAGEQIRDLLSGLKVYVSKRRIVAVLGYDEDYVLSALKPVLPQGIEPKRYLEKIVTHNTNLPSPTSKQLAMYASNLLKSLTGLEDEQAAELGMMVVRLALQNPRRVKIIVLSYANSLGQIPNYRELRLEKLKSLLITSVTAGIGLFPNDDLEESLMKGTEDNIVTAMNKSAEKKPSRSKEIQALVREVNDLKPYFAMHTPLDLRLTTTLAKRRATFRQQAKETYDWRTTLSPLISNAATYGLELPASIAYSSCQIAVPASSKITMSPQISPIAHALELKGSRLVLCRLSWDKAEMIVVVSSFSMPGRVGIELPRFLRHVFDDSAKNVAKRGLAVWVIDDAGILPETEFRGYIEEARVRSKGLKNPLMFQYTPASKVSALIEFLLKTARK